MEAEPVHCIHSGVYILWRSDANRGQCGAWLFAAEKEETEQTGPDTQLHICCQTKLGSAEQDQPNCLLDEHKQLPLQHS